MFKKIKLFKTSPDNILLDAGVAAGCALANIKWKGNTALLMEIPIIIMPMTTANGNAYSPEVVSRIIDCCILGIKRCPVML